MNSAITPLEILKSLSDATAEVVGKVASSVVSVGSGRRWSVGSGVVWSPPGYIVTCSHVVGGDGVVKVGFGEGSSLEARVVGRDPYSDVALLKAEASEFKPIELGKPESTKVGQYVFALANPFGRHPSVTSGLVTSVGISLRRWGGVTMEKVIVTDAPLNPGYSGGPLVDVSGKMIGLNAAYVSSRGIAVPVDTVEKISESLAREGKIRRAYLGITSSTIPLPREIASQSDIRQDGGVIVLSVEKDSPAKRSGLALGDVIIKFEGKPVVSVHDLPRLLTEELIEKEASLWILRGERLKELTITPVARV